MQDAADAPAAPAVTRSMTPQRWTTIALVAVPAVALIGGAAARWGGEAQFAHMIFAAGTVPVLAALIVTIAMSLGRGETGLDIIAAAAMIGSLALGEYVAGVVIALMFAGGQGLEAYAEGRARREMSALLGRMPRLAQRVEGESLASVAVKELRPGDRILVRSGEVVPVDGVLEEESATLDESALTGEPLPVSCRRGDALASGAMNAGRPFVMRASRAAAESTYAGIVRLVEAAQRSKAPMARLAERWALMFLAATAVLAGAAYAITGDPLRALAVIVVATPCPLILAIPVAMVSGMSRAARRGILVKSARALEALAGARRLLFDKTGTLTEGGARLASVVVASGVTADEVLRLAGSLAQASPHVLAESVAASARERGLHLSLAQAVHEEPGAGLDGQVEGRRIVLGSPNFVTGRAVMHPQTAQRMARVMHDDAAVMLVAIDGAVAGALVLADHIRLDAARAIRMLRAAGIERIGLVTGDRPAVATAVGNALGVDDVHAAVPPEGKVAVVAAARGSGPIVMVGDGINDAPALSAADVGIAMGARGAAASAQAADIVLLVDRIDRLVEAFAIARRTRAIAASTAAIGIALSLAAMGVAALGYLPPVMGALLQEAIDVAAVLNALRALASGRGERRGAGLAAAEATRLRHEHRDLVPVIDKIREVADRLPELPPRAALRELGRIDSMLREKVVPHEVSDDAALYPRVGRLIGGDDPMGAMSRGHREIFGLARKLGQDIAGLPAEGPDPAMVREMQRLLYGLEAVLRLHFAQEDEIYHALADGRAEAGAGR
jgi:heavy metal translocating P-type ATPase